MARKHDPELWCDGPCRDIMLVSRSWQCKTCGWVLCCTCIREHICLPLEFWKEYGYHGKLVEYEQIADISA
jgi:hypothetical protein